MAVPAVSDPIQQEIIDEFQFFDDWMQRYEYIIDLGRQLPEFPERYKTPEAKVQGCQSQVWMVSSGDAEALHFAATSDSAIVTGLIALLLRVYSGRPAKEIVETQPEFVDAIGLKAHLSPTRSNGLAAMLQRIKGEAQGVLSAA